MIDPGMLAKVVLVVMVLVGTLLRTILPAMKKMDSWSDFNPKYLATAITNVAAGGGAAWLLGDQIMALIPMGTQLWMVAFTGLGIGIFGNHILNFAVPFMAKNAQLEEEVLKEVPEPPAYTPPEIDMSGMSSSNEPDMEYTAPTGDEES